MHKIIEKMFLISTNSHLRFARARSSRDSHNDMTSSSALVTYIAMVTAAENDDVEALRHLLLAGADVNANLDDDIGESESLRVLYVGISLRRPIVNAIAV